MLVVGLSAKMFQKLKVTHRIINGECLKLKLNKKQPISELLFLINLFPIMVILTDFPLGMLT